MSRQDEIATAAIRKSTLKSIKEKKESRLLQLKKDYERQVQEINIMYATDSERLKAKYAAAEYAKNEKARKRAERKIETEKKNIALVAKERKLTLAEEIGSAIVQGIGIALFIAATAILNTLALSRFPANSSISKPLICTLYSVFGGSMILMYLFSCLQHALTNYTAKEVFNRLSHVLTFVAIGIVYSIYSLLVIKGVYGWILFGIVCGLIFIGAMFYAIAGRRFNILNIILCVIAGFSGIFLCKNLFDALKLAKFSLLISSGVIYLIGVIFYSLKKVKFMHLIGNCVMLAGSINIFFSMFYLYNL